MQIPFLKAHGAKNDFLLTSAADVPEGVPHVELARAICDRHTGIGADGWLQVGPGDQDADAAIQLYNSDGSLAEISGNGTRCAASYLIYSGMVMGDHVRIRTGAGVKHLRLLDRSALLFMFEMNMGAPEIRQQRFELPLSVGTRDVTLLWVGNPQCAVPVEDFDFDWRAEGAEIESHPHFPDRTNVSFFRAVDEHRLEVRFYERGAGETMSSGTGSTGAVAAAMARGLISSPVQVLTPAGALELRCDLNITKDITLIGPAEIIAEGAFYYAKIEGNEQRTN
jgi:diaminopimelate epimerase